MNSASGFEISSINQTIISGQVLNSLTGESIEHKLAIKTNMRLPGSLEFKPLNAPVSLKSGGYFSVSGSPERILPIHLDMADSVEFKIEISASGFVSIEDLIIVAAPEVMPEQRNEEISGKLMSVNLIDAPIISKVYQLLPEPVGLSGLLIEDNDPASPVNGANVRVIAPDVSSSVVTNQFGRFRLEQLPVATAVTIEVDVAGDLTTVEHLVDYATALNTRVISLNG